MRGSTWPIKHPQLALVSRISTASGPLLISSNEWLRGSPLFISPRSTTGADTRIWAWIWNAMIRADNIAKRKDDMRRGHSFSFR